MLKKAVQQGPSNSLYHSLGERPGCPLLRASNEHSFIVRVLRAKRAPGRSPPPAGGHFQHPARSLLDLMTKLLLRSPQAETNYTGRSRRLAIKPVAVGRVPLFEQAAEKSISAQQRFDGLHVWNKKRPLPQDAQQGRPASPQRTITL